MNKTKPSVIDLFCGCGGFSLGAELAGFRSLVAIDIEPTLQSSFGKNFPSSKPLEADVSGINRADWSLLIGDKRPDGIIGGPPCQGFSRIGKRSKDDPRNTLIHHFYRHVNLLQPKFFVMENVEGLLDEENIGVLQTAIESVSHKYTVLGPFVINAADFGAATNRRRALVVGYDPTELTLEQRLFDQVAIERKATVRDAISDLPAPVPRNPRDKSDFGWANYKLDPISSVLEYAKSLRQPPPDGLGWSHAIERLSSGTVSGMFETRHTAEVANRYRSIPNGTSDRVSKSYRLSWDGQCPTIRAGTGSEKGSFQAVRPLHPSEPRVITVREAARMQAFPDWFIFHPTVWHSFRMIGNSVSPSVSFGILSTILKSLGHNESTTDQLVRRAA
ncbi:DNA cytosine methyltransferase [Paraburkholderia sp. BL25I1N1]|uniref:DNA cytosine methyltransferase n=1 Tax=Paraburkholderia sp. BL25I1N1 TaxID=1938804 RepID=UPI000D080FD1|nr:DNA cytosine methyltransferase [Paraburkholderia sp. BL25I1N1]PRY03198.1 DNA (cytosine-5)-methyltransferase 1 [Paraburkholderia sp. BL25I1N1]